MQINNYLQQLGLSEKEIKTYLACLELGESTITPIVERVNLPKTTVYHLLEKLKEKSLIEILLRGSKYIYLPYSPRKILTLYRNRQEKLKEEVENLEKALPELNQLFSHLPFQPKVRFFQGQKELQDIYEELLEQPLDEEWYVGETDKIVEALSEKYLSDWVKRRVARGIKSKSVRVHNDVKVADEFIKSDGYLRTYRFAPADFKCPTHILIYGHNVAIITTSSENFGLVITSREFALTMKNWFKQLWKISR